ncbi:cytokine receptor family member B16 isoform X1 [Conger conger]|uniref:cytokine receptor family member B16 isoform X1 n=2 Tax=Conger conger TaxID=82655 RepID=UPI002A59DC76|nr:cytokine receptor family member B16 isoform X1 [Conger conger]
MKERGTERQSQGLVGREGSVEGRRGMPMNGGPSALMLLLPLLLRLISPIRTDTGKLSSPQGVLIESTNMKHWLKWRPLQAPCHPISYSVQYQGYFELYIKNGSWEDAPYCQNMDGVVCDLTASLGSDSDYNVRLRAECRGQVSDWASPAAPFNRRETNLTVPKMNAAVSGDSIQVAFTDLTETVDVILKHWRKGLEQEASTQHITMERSPFHLGGLQEGATYCLSAQTALHNNKRSVTTETQCFNIAVSIDPAHSWLKPTVVCVALVIVTGLGLAAFWCVTKCCPTLLNTCWPKEPLPDALLHREADTRLRFAPGEELHELCQPVLVLIPDPV